MNTKEEREKIIFEQFDKMQSNEIRELVNTYLNNREPKRTYNKREKIIYTIHKYRAKKDFTTGRTLKVKEVIQLTADEHNITYKAVEKVYYTIKTR